MRLSLPVGDSRAAFEFGHVLLIAGIPAWLLLLSFQRVVDIAVAQSSTYEANWLTYVLPIAVPTWLAVLAWVASSNAHRAGRWLLASAGVMLLLVLIAMIATSVVPNNALVTSAIFFGAIYLPALPTSYLLLIGKPHSQDVH